MRCTYWLAALLLAGCFHATPFDSEPDETDVTRGELRQLESLGEPPSRWTFLAFGDTHDEYDDLEKTIRVMNQSDARLALIAGDVTDRGLLQEFEWSGALYRELKMPFFTAIGNHDHLSGGREIYEKMYGPTDYSFRHGPLKFVLFDSNYLENPSAPNREWLRAQVEDLGDALGAVLVLHLPVLETDSREGGDVHVFYDELLQTGNVVLVVDSHGTEQKLQMAHGVPVLQCGTFQTLRRYNYVDFDGQGFSFRSCLLDECEALEPTEVEQ